MAHQTYMLYYWGDALQNTERPAGGDIPKNMTCKVHEKFVMSAYVTFDDRLLVVVRVPLNSEWPPRHVRTALAAANGVEIVVCAAQHALRVIDQLTVCQGNLRGA